MKLNLTAKTKEQELILQYLEKSASEELADKINNGVQIEKDGKPLLNKKDLDGFMRYACDEARKQAEKGAISACVESNTVFGWAIHYFEEDSIIGKLYTLDGTEYKPLPKAKPKTAPPSVPSTPPKPQPKPQLSLFDILSPQESGPTPPAVPSEDEEKPKTKPGPALSVAHPQGSPLYQRYMKVQNQYPHAVIAWRLGDFYEVFGENAKMIADELDLTLTGRDCGLSERVPMIGFPYHSSDTYFRKISQLHSLVIADKDDIQLYNPEPEQTIDYETGEILSEDTADDGFEKDLRVAKAFDKECLCILYELFGDKLTVR